MLRLRFERSVVLSSTILSAILFSLHISVPNNVCGQATTTPAAESDAAPKVDESQQKRFADFSAKLSGSVFVGQFTVDGENGSPKEERYELESVTKLPAEEMWLFKARIRYGERDVTVPLPLRVSWAGETPVIVVDQVSIPGLGTFDSRVVISGDRYAGTWQHGNVGGHLFGRIERAEKAKAKE